MRRNLLRYNMLRFIMPNHIAGAVRHKFDELRTHNHEPNNGKAVIYAFFSYLKALDHEARLRLLLLSIFSQNAEIGQFGR